MADQITAKERSWVMSRVHGKNTSPERAVRSIIHRLGYRFRLHRKDLPGTPDIVLARHQCVVFVHGCFWHRHKGCKRASMPQSNVDYWEKKFSRNVERDQKHRKDLRKLGWRTIVVWECELRDKNKLADRLFREIGKF
jgi:DNA mismatch endonuclease (patch repair protein)